MTIPETFDPAMNELGREREAPSALGPLAESLVNQTWREHTIGVGLIKAINGAFQIPMTKGVTRADNHSWPSMPCQDGWPAIEPARVDHRRRRQNLVRKAKDKREAPSAFDDILHFGH